MMNTWIWILVFFIAISAVGLALAMFCLQKGFHDHPRQKKWFFPVLKKQSKKNEKAAVDDGTGTYEKLRGELLLKEGTIASNLLIIEQSNGFLVDLLKRIQKIHLNTQSRSTRSEINTLIELIREQLNNYDRDHYEQLYTPENSRFIDSLCRKHPNLTSMEKKLCMLLSMGLSTKEISDITMQNCRAIEMARHRLRSKFQLNRSDNIIEYLSGLRTR